MLYNYNVNGRGITMRNIYVKCCRKAYLNVVKEIEEDYPRLYNDLMGMVNDSPLETTRDLMILKYAIDDKLETVYYKGMISRIEREALGEYFEEIISEKFSQN